MMKNVHNIFRSRKRKGILALVLICVFIFAPAVSFAAGPPPPIAPRVSDSSGATVPSPSFWACISYNPFSGKNIACAIVTVTYYIYALAGKIVVAIFYFVNTALVFSSHITDNPVVRGGYDAVLAIANLGFVLGIIAIAISTILGFKSYGAKQLIWHFIIIALLVNFSFLVCGIIINAADNVTKAFVADIGLNIENGDFANSMATAFNYPSFYTTKAIVGSGSSDAMAKCMIEKGKTLPPLTVRRLFSGAAASEFNTIKAACSDKSITSALISMLFAITFMFLFALTAGALAVMLFIRYAYLSILIIIAPVAWLFYIFPTFSHFTRQWWNLFIKYVLFAPIMIFFLYLAISVAIRQKDYVNKWSGTSDSSKTTNIDASTIAGSLTTSDGPIENLASKLLLIVLMMGGLYTAQSLSIKGASAAMGVATNTRKRVQRAATNYARDRAVRAGSVVAGAIEPATTKMQTAGATWSQTKEGGLKGWGKFAGGWAARGITKATGIRAGARAVETLGVRGGEDLVAKRARELPKTWEQVVHQLTSQDTAGKVASAEFLYKNKKLHEVDPKQLGSKAAFASVGKEKLYEDVSDAMFQINENKEKQGLMEKIGQAQAPHLAEEKRLNMQAEQGRAMAETTGNPDAYVARIAMAEQGAAEAREKANEAAANVKVKVKDINGNEVEKGAQELLDKISAKDVANMSKSDMSKSAIKDIFKSVAKGDGLWGMSPEGTKVFADSIARGIAQSGGDLTGTAIAQLNGAQHQDFRRAYIEGVKQMHLGQVEENELIDKIDKAIGNSALYAGFGRDERESYRNTGGDGGGGTQNPT